MLNLGKTDESVMNPVANEKDQKPRVSEHLDEENSTIEDIQKEVNLKKENIQVHSMPQKFLPEKPKKKMGAGQKIALMSIVLILVLIALIAGAIWFINNQMNSPEENTNQVAMVNQNENTNSNENANTNQNENNNTNENTNSNENANTNQNENNNTNENVNISPPVIPVQNVDQDNDGLNYEEELVFNTDPDRADTDRDGYVDGLEVRSLYNPLIPNQPLENSGLVSIFENQLFGYSFFYPSSWLADSLNGNMEEVVILPNSESGESFAISALANETGMTLTQAFEDLDPILGNVDEFDNFSLGGFPAMISKDSSKVLMVTEKNIYYIIHDSSGNFENSFDNIFIMMLNSFKILDAENVGTS